MDWLIFQECVEMLSDNSVSTVTDLYEDFMKRHGHRYIREVRDSLTLRQPFSETTLL